eukprot:07157.XXX_222626_222183_1 [CDS] Oithona nana genome sequencing.
MTKLSNFYKNNTRVTANCPLQTIGDQKNGKGMKLHKRVEWYADNQEEWLKDFFDVFDKLQQKVENPQDLVQGPNGYWNITEDMSCCFEREYRWEKSDSDVEITPNGGIDALECQEICQNPDSHKKM